MVRTNALFVQAVAGLCSVHLFVLGVGHALVRIAHLAVAVADCTGSRLDGLALVCMHRQPVASRWQAGVEMISEFMKVSAEHVATYGLNVL